MDVTLISAIEIGRRIGLAPATSWRWARRGLFGPCINPASGWWRWRDDAELSERLKLLEGVRRPSATNVWRVRQQSEHVERLGEFVTGERTDTDKEDMELAATILAVAARRWQRRASGMKSPCAVSAEVVAQKWLTRSYMDDPQIALRLLSASEALAGRAGNTKTAGG